MTAQLLEQPQVANPGVDADDLIHIVCESCYPDDSMKISFCALDVTEARVATNINDEDLCVVCYEIAEQGRCPVCKYVP